MTYPPNPNEQPYAVPQSAPLIPPPSQPDMPYSQPYPPPYAPFPGYPPPNQPLPPYGLYPGFPLPAYGQMPYFMPLPTNPLAVASLVLGIVGLIMALNPCMFVFTIIGEALAIIFGAVSLNQSAHRPYSPASRGMAITGLILGGIAVLLTVFIVVIYVIELTTMPIN